MMMARSLYTELRGFDEGYFLHVEDVDLCVTLLKLGGATYVAPSVRVVHQGGSSKTSPLKVEWYKAKGFCRYFSKHFKGVYPPGFVTIINVLVWVRLVIRSPLLLLRRERRPRSQSTIESIQPTDTSD